MLGLRLREGIDLKIALSLGLPEQQAQKLVMLAERLEGQGLCRIDGDRIALTPEGMLVSNSVISGFLS